MLDRLATPGAGTRRLSIGVALALLAGGAVALSGAAQAVPDDGKLLYGLTAADELVEIRTEVGPGTPVAITGLDADDDLVGIDVRPATGVLYGVARSNDVLFGADSLYTISPTGAATKVDDVLVPLSGTSFAVDVDPEVDTIRVVSDTGQNLRVAPDGGLVTVDDPVNGAGTPSVAALAHTDSVADASATTLYALDTGNNALSSLDGPTGTLTPVAGLTAGVLAPGQQVGYDVDGADDEGFAVVTVDDVRGLFTVDPAADPALAPVAAAGDLTGIDDLAVATPRVGFAATAYAAAEGTSATLTLTRVGDVLDAQAVGYALADGTATGADYTSTAGTATFAAGAGTAVITVPLAGDVLVEGDQAFTVTLTDSAGDDIALLTATTATVTITDVPPSVLSIDPEVSVAENGGPASITVTRAPAGPPVSVGYTVTAGTAGALDFVAESGTLSFAGGDSSESVTVDLVDDTEVEPNETVVVTLSDPGGLAVLGASTTSTLTIVSEDGKAVTTLGLLATQGVRAPALATLRGVLTAGGVPIPGASVAITYRFADGSAPVGLARVVTTDGNGAFLTQIKPSRNLFWQALYSGDAQRQAAASPQRRTLVGLSAARVSGQTTISRGQVSTLNGYIQPGSTRPRVQLRYLAANGVWTNLTAPVQVGLNGRFTISRRYANRGTFRLQVVGLRSAQNEPSVSGTIVLRVI